MSLILQGTTRELRFSDESSVASPVELPPPEPPPLLGRPRVRQERRPASHVNSKKMCFSPWPIGSWNPSTREFVRRTQKTETRRKGKVVIPASLALQSAVPPLVETRPEGAKLVDAAKAARAAETPAPPRSVYPARVANAPAPFSQAAIERQPAVVEPSGDRARTRFRPPYHLGAWIIASVLVALLSYEVASRVMAHVSAPSATASR